MWRTPESTSDFKPFQPCKPSRVATSTSKLNAHGPKSEGRISAKGVLRDCDQHMSEYVLKEAQQRFEMQICISDLKLKT